MKINQITENSITLTLPKKIRYLGFSLIIIGIMVSIFLLIINNYQISPINNPDFGILILNLSLWGVTVPFLILEIPSMIYFFGIRNRVTAFGYVLLIILNITVFVATYSSIFSFSPVFVTGIYFITHFKTIQIDKTKAGIEFRERVLFLFHTRSTIPIEEIREIVLEYRYGLDYMGNQHRYRIKLYLLEKDPGFEDVPIAAEEEKDSPQFFRPHTLRKTLISKPVLIDSSYFGFGGKDMGRINQILKTISQLFEFNFSEEIDKDNLKIIKYRK